MAVQVPLATYRLQFNKDFRFQDAQAILPYLRRLGITHVYASPIFASRAGSAHGYDVIEPGRLDPELGTEEEFTGLLARLRAERLGLVVDIVPNHMAADVSNPWWRDVLVHGPNSRFAEFFDIDWDGGGGKLVLPVLGRPLEEAVQAGEIAVARRGAGWAVTYFDKRWPVNPETDSLARKAQEGRKKAVTALLEAQAYRLVDWRTEAPNYRRFFDINDLASVRAEREEVFTATHRLALDLVSRAEIIGLRVDHVDGLYDPSAYLERLRSGAGEEAYLLVEKILAEGEALPRHWPVEGTTGYDYLAMVNGLLAEPDGLQTIGRAYSRFTGIRHSFRHEVRMQKRRVLDMLFANEVSSLTRWAAELFREDLGLVDVAQGPLSEALKEVTAELPVYRVYADAFGMNSGDARLVAAACDRAKETLDEAASALLGPLRRLLTLDYPTGLSEERRSEWLRAVMRWQQLSGPATAKGLEDTAFYRYNRLISLNEVGANAQASAPERVHRFLATRRRAWPHSMNASSTHDTKRSEDVRARISALTWMGQEWTETVLRWSEWNRRWKRDVDGLLTPDPNMEWLLYQTLVGAWPMADEEREGLLPRVHGFLTKAAREAKEHTSWLDVNEAYEAAVLAFAEALFDPKRSGRFLRDLQTVAARVAPLGAVASLTQLAVKATAPGVPDFYQGQELWDLSLTDPDNRRPVDYSRRTTLLRSLDGETDLTELVHDWADGRIKLYLTRRLLGLRAERPRLFRDGSYLPLDTGPGGYLFAFARRQEDDWLLTIVPRMVRVSRRGLSLPLGSRLAEGGPVVLPDEAPRQWRDVFTGREHVAKKGRLSAGRLMDRIPVAVLTVSPSKNGGISV